MSLGVGALITVAPGMAGGGTAIGDDAVVSAAERRGRQSVPARAAQRCARRISGPPNPTGTKAFERAIDIVNRLDPQPDLILFTGDLTHESETAGEHAKRMQLFQSLTARLKAKKVMHVPGEHDAALDGGALYRQFFGETHYSFDHRGVHFVALDNVSRGKPEVGAEQLAWLARDLARFPHTAPIIVFTHRPLFDLRPEWEWFTRDGDEVLNVLAPFESVTILYGHIHRHDVHQSGMRPLRIAVADLRVSRSGDVRRQEAASLRQGEAVPEPRHAASERRPRQLSVERRRADSANSAERRRPANLKPGVLL